MLGARGTGTLTPASPADRVDAVPVSYVLVDGVPYVRTPRRSGLLAHISHDARVTLHLCPHESPHDRRTVQIHGDATVAQGFEYAAQLVSTLDRRFAGLLPPPLPIGTTSGDESTAILRVSPSSDTDA